MPAGKRSVVKSAHILKWLYAALVRRSFIVSPVLNTVTMAETITFHQLQKVVSLLENNTVSKKNPPKKKVSSSHFLSLQL